MEPSLENGWFDEEEAARDTDKDDSSIDAETEAVLYSLVHHKPPSDEEIDQPIANENSPPSYSISRRTKASRWDRVKGITAGRNSANDLTLKMMHTSQGISVPDFINIQIPQPSFGQGLFGGSSVPATSASGNNCSSSSGSPKSNPSKPKPNIRAVLESLAGYPTCSTVGPEKKRKRKQKKSARVPRCGTGSFSESDCNENAGQVPVAEAPSSKYNVTLSKSPRIDPDVIEVLADSDMESECSVDSIVVVEPPPRTPPPLVVLEDSSDELERAAEAHQPPTVNNLIVHCSATGHQTDLNKSVVVLSDTEENVSKKKKKKKKQKTSNRRKKKKQCGTQSPGGGGQDIPLINDCNLWTPEMARFYNQHWGSRDLDVVRQNMPGHPRHWRVLEVDRCGPRWMKGPHAKTRCRNCNQLGHPMNRCPDPVKKPMCYMCGETGHKEPRCPNKICLKCGRPSSLYTVGCTVCSAPGSDPCICTTCGKIGHYVYQCQTAWRGFHSVTSPMDISNYSNQTIFKPAKKLSCCVCARMGHTARDCPANRSMPQPNDVRIPAPPHLNNMIPGLPHNAGPPMQPVNGNFLGLTSFLHKQSHASKRKERRKKKRFREVRPRVNVYRESYINYSKIS